MLVIFVILPLVKTIDVTDFSSNDMKNQYIYSHKPFSYANRFTNRNDVDNHDELQSEYGVFERRRPKFLTKKNITDRFGNIEDSKYYEFPDNNSDDIDTKDKVNKLLRNYLSKLYQQKYPTRQNDKKQQSKFIFEDDFWGWKKNKTKKFRNKFLGLFTIVQFNNSQCQTTGSTGTYLGTCYHDTECANLNGTALGACADGYGVCCVFRYSCGSSSSRNCTYFESPGYPDYDPSGSAVLPPSSSTLPPVTMNPSPTPDPRLKYYYQIRHRWTRQVTSSTSCSINIFKQSDAIQRMRIDFIDLELRTPTNGTCTMERLIITGQNMNSQIPMICGYNTGQHIYVDVSMLTGPLQLAVLSTTGDRKRFKIRVCQIAMDCDGSNNCLQYYTGATGTISSFNYDQAAIANRSVPGYLNNLNYAICIRKEAGYCSITYTNTMGGIEYPFQLTNIDEIGQSTVPPGQAGVEIFNCPNDYIVIGGTRLCGNKFNDGSLIQDFTMNAPITDTSAGPIVIPVRTNNLITGRGFKLFYTQNRCTMT